MKTWEFQDVYINAFAACAGVRWKEKGLMENDLIMSAKTCMTEKIHSRKRKFHY